MNVMRYFFFYNDNLQPYATKLWKTLIIAIWSGSEPDHSPTYEIDIDYETCNYFSHRNKQKLIEIYVYVSFNTATNTTTTKKEQKCIKITLHSHHHPTPANDYNCCLKYLARLFVHFFTLITMKVIVKRQPSRLGIYSTIWFRIPFDKSPTFLGVLGGVFWMFMVTASLWNDMP